MNRIKKELAIFATAIVFMTRIPIRLNYSQEVSARCNRYFPFIGAMVGGVAAGVFWGASHLFSTAISIVLSMVVTVLFTGAFHEDGFADVCDGFGGGHTKDRTMAIMKDSNVGAYGVIGIVLILLLKFVCLDGIPDRMLPISLIAGHTLSRFMTVWTMHSLVYVRKDDSSKSAAVTTKLHFVDLLFAFVLSAGVMFLFSSWWYAIVPAAMFVVKVSMDCWFKQRIDGYTGDCLGAIQQVTEIVAYLSILAIIELT